MQSVKNVTLVKLLSKNAKTRPLKNRQQEKLTEKLHIRDKDSCNI